ncbi:MAG: hypothetical protein ACREP6_01395, partial [Candidatus Binataceae bacterium]
MDFRLADFQGLRNRPREFYRRRGWWGQIPMWRRVRDAARERPLTRAVIDEQGSYSYAQLWDQAGGLARA